MVCLAAGLAVMASGRNCQAGCGDYVFVRNASGQLVRASSLMKDHNDNPQGAQTPVLPEETFPIKVPCQGPNCSSGSQLPATPVPPSPQRSVQESTALLLHLDSGDEETGNRFNGVTSSNDHELHYPQSIFHPPR
jgi:hypothetical protein